MDKAEENRLEFVATEISLGFTLIESAQLAYRLGHRERGESAHQKAATAYRSADHFLGLSRGDNATDTLRNELDRLRSSLDQLQAEFGPTAL